MKYLTIPAFFVALFAFAPAASACSVIADSIPKNPTAAIAKSDVAFIGTVESISQDRSANGEYRISFEVNEAYKGELGTSIIVRAQSSSAACGYDDGYDRFAKGSVWAIYASGDETAGYTTNAHSFNTKYASVAEAKESLGSKTAPVAAFARDLAIGARGEDVAALQRYLIEKGSGVSASALASMGATGYFGQLTKNALAEFQAKAGIAPSLGYFGPKTRTYIGAGVEAPQPTFTGTLSAVDTGCFADGICSATVGGKKVILLAGLRVDVPPVGSVGGVESIGDLEGKIGSEVSVYGAKASEEGYDYTLYGNSAYYLQVMDSAKTVSYTGTIGCRPAKDTDGAIIALCSFGLKTDDGKWYALRDEDGSSDIAGYESTDRVTVTGTLTDAPSDGFKGEGTIEVSDIEETS